MSGQKGTIPKKLLWIDLEMTGLDPAEQRIIEVAAIVTDFDFNELDLYEAVIHQPKSVLDKSDAWVKDTFGKNGLFEQVKKSDKSESTITQAFVKFIDKNFDEPAIIAGSSIHQDRRFIRRWWPEIEERLHYRMMDVSSLKIYMMGKHKYVLSKPETHRALDDIRGSINEFKDYLKKLKK